jgi:conjugal transfer pilus assembly protein TraV
MKKILIASVVISCFSGCVSLSGLDASTSFTCPKPEGVLCENMSTIYERGQKGTLPSQQGSSNKKDQENKTSVSAPVQTTGLMPLVGMNAGLQNQTVFQTKQVGTLPLRSNAKILRIWVNAWEDNDGDLHDQAFMYVTLNQGRWLLDHTRQKIAEPFGPVKAPSTSSFAPVETKNNKLVTRPSGNQLEDVRRALGIVEPASTSEPK